MATTLEEISESRRVNRSWWNSQVRFRVTLLREELRSPSGVSNHRELLIAGIRRALKRRRDFEYLREELKP